MFTVSLDDYTAEHYTLPGTNAAFYCNRVVFPACDIKPILRQYTWYLSKINSRFSFLSSFYVLGRVCNNKKHSNPKENIKCCNECQKQYYFRFLCVSEVSSSFFPINNKILMQEILFGLDDDEMQYL